MPDIQLVWPAQKLVFLAQGDEPFTLAFGNSAVSANGNNGIQQLLQTLEDAGQKPDQVTLAAIEANPLFSPIPKSTPWKLIALWAFLILGTFVLGYMAWYLYQQMQQSR